MTADEVRQEVQRQIDGFRYQEPPPGLLGNPWSEDRYRKEIAILRENLIIPQPATVDLDSQEEEHGCCREVWLVTKDLNGYVVFFDPKIGDFGLAWPNEGQGCKSVNVRGDLVTTFCAR